MEYLLSTWGFTDSIAYAMQDTELNEAKSPPSRIMQSTWGDQSYNRQIQQKSVVEKCLKLEKRKSKSHPNKDGMGYHDKGTFQERNNTDQEMLDNH